VSTRPARDFEESNRLADSQQPAEEDEERVIEYPTPRRNPTSRNRTGDS